MPITNDLYVHFFPCQLKLYAFLYEHRILERFVEKRAHDLVRALPSTPARAVRQSLRALLMIERCTLSKKAREYGSTRVPVFASCSKNLRERNRKKPFCSNFYCKVVFEIMFAQIERTHVASPRLPTRRVTSTFSSSDICLQPVA